MQNAIHVEVDLEVGAAYVRYRERDAQAPGAHSVRVTEDLVVHYDAKNRVAGIELIGVTLAAVEAGSSFAEQNGLTFPSLRAFVREGPVATDVIGVANAGRTVMGQGFIGEKV